MSRTTWLIMAAVAAVILIGGTVFLLRNRDAGMNIPFVNTLTSVVGKQTEQKPEYDPPSRFMKDDAIVSPQEAPPEQLLQPIQLPPTLSQ